MITNHLLILDPGNEPYILGQAARPANVPAHSPLVVMLLVFVAAGIGLVGLVGREGVKAYRLQQHGTNTTARVLDRWSESDGDGTSYTIRYQFQVQNRPYTGTDSVSRAIYTSLAIGDQVEIRHLLTDPQVSRVVVPYPFRGVALIAGFALLWNLFVWVALVSAARHTQKIRYLYRHGQVVRGELVQIEGDTDDGDWYLVVKYRFQTFDGRVLQGRQRQKRNDLRHTALPHPGRPLAIWYAPPNFHHVL